MRKKWNLFLAVCLSAILGVLSACGGGGEIIQDTDTNLIITLFEGGYGTKGIEAVAQDFEQAYAEQGYTVSIVSGAQYVGTSGVETKLQNIKGNTTDLFLVGDVNVRNILSRGENYLRGSGYPYALEDLTEDVFNQKVYGEETLYRDKINPQYAAYNAYAVDGQTRYYSTSWAGGPSGFAYNADHFAANGWSLPNTTDELKALTVDMKAAGYKPFVWIGGASYWNYAVLPWWRQFADDEEVERFFNCDPYGDGDQSEGHEVFKSEARYQAYKLLEDCIYEPSTSDFSNSNSYGEGSCITYDKTTAQTILWDNTKKVCMMPNGDWVENEMKNKTSSTASIGLMRVPVSSNVLWTDIGRKNYRFQTVRDDATLSRVIQAVDGGESGLEGVSAADFAAIRTMRSYTYTEGFVHQAYIPVYANAKEVAKKFLLFMASDRSAQRYYDQSGCYLTYGNDNVVVPKDATLLQQNVKAMLQQIDYVSAIESANKIFYKTTLQFNVGFIENYIGTVTSSRMTAEQYYSFVYDSVKESWNTYLNLAK